MSVAIEYTGTSASDATQGAARAGLVVSGRHGRCSVRPAIGFGGHLSARRRAAAAVVPSPPECEAVPDCAR